MENEFRMMRRKQQQLSEDDSIKILKNATAGVLNVLSEDGYPYGVPISYVYVDGRLIFHSALRGHKMDAIRHCNKASFTVIDRDDVKPKEFTTYFRSVICFGRVRLIENDEEKLAALRQLGERYNPGDTIGIEQEINKDFSHVAMIEFSIEHITGNEAIELIRMKAIKV